MKIGDTSSPSTVSRTQNTGWCDEDTVHNGRAKGVSTLFLEAVNGNLYLLL